MQHIHVDTAPYVPASEMLGGSNYTSAETASVVRNCPKCNAPLTLMNAVQRYKTPPSTSLPRDWPTRLKYEAACGCALNAEDVVKLTSSAEFYAIRNVVDAQIHEPVQSLPVVTQCKFLAYQHWLCDFRPHYTCLSQLVAFEGVSATAKTWAEQNDYLPPQYRVSLPPQSQEFGYSSQYPLPMQYKSAQAQPQPDNSGLGGLRASLEPTPTSIAADFFSRFERKKRKLRLVDDLTSSS